MPSRPLRCRHSPHPASLARAARTNAVITPSMRFAPSLLQTVLWPDSSSTWARMWLVVVLPLVPVTAMTFLRTMPDSSARISGSIRRAICPGITEPLPLPVFRTIQYANFPQITAILLRSFIFRHLFPFPLLRCLCGAWRFLLFLTQFDFVFPTGPECLHSNRSIGNKNTKANRLCGWPYLACLTMILRNDCIHRVKSSIRFSL